MATTRDWVNTPPGDLTPPKFADAVSAAGKELTKGRGAPKVTIRVLDEAVLLLVELLNRVHHVAHGCHKFIQLPFGDHQRGREEDLVARRGMRAGHRARPGDPVPRGPQRR